MKNAYRVEARVYAPDGTEIANAGQEVASQFVLGEAAGQTALMLSRMLSADVARDVAEAMVDHAAKRVAP